MKFVKFVAICSILFMSNILWAQGNTQIRDRNTQNKADVEQWAATVTATTVFGLFGISAPGFVVADTWYSAASGAGAVTNGTQRVTLASDDPTVATADLDQDNCDVTAIASTQKALAAGRWKLRVTGASVSIKVGSAVFVAAGGDKGMTIPEGDSEVINCPAGCNVYHISTSTGGEICFIPML